MPNESRIFPIPYLLKNRDFFLTRYMIGPYYILIGSVNIILDRLIRIVLVLGLLILVKSRP